jgi:hypothetical protein
MQKYVETKGEVGWKEVEVGRKRVKRKQKKRVKSRIVRNGDPWDRNEKKFVGKIKGEVCLKEDNSFRKKKKSVD